MSKIFISYSHKDEKWKDWLQSHLSVLEKQGKLDIWEDRQIAPGSDWLPAIEKSLNDSHIAILLISRHFLTSAFILGKEIPVFLKRRQSDGLCVFPLIIEPCAWQAVAWLSPIQGFPKDNQPLAGREEYLIDEQLALLANKIYQLDKSAPSSDSEEYAPLPPEKLQVSRLPHTGSKLIGRSDELAMLDKAWTDSKTNILTLKAMGGTGKTSLMKAWIDQLAVDSFRGANAVYTWSFYSQGSAEDKQTSADIFFDEALAFFGYQGDPIASAHDKGFKLAELINQQRSLLVLDGLEPLQNPVGVMHGDLKDKGLQALLQQLAAHNQGLCLISSRQEVVELAGKPLVLAHDLGQLQIPDGVELLKSFGVHGAKADLEKAVNEMAGHALALNLLGNYVKTLFKGDIRQRDKIKNLSDEREEGKHAEKVMAAYEIHLKGTTALSILYMMGLFDRPASAAAIQHLRDAKIPDLTDQLGNEDDWFYALGDLRQQQLLNSSIEENEEDSNKLDTHPLIREYFAKRLKEVYSKAWQQAHSQLYHYYKALPEKEQPDTLDEMEPLFAAIAHGCAAGMHQEALNEVYWPRIHRETDNYVCKKLGAFGADLSSTSHFFSQHWHTPAAKLTDRERAGVLNWAAFRLRALGRLQEAVEPMQADLEMAIKQKDWIGGAIAASNLSELQLTQGAISLAIKAAQQSVEFADKSGDEFQRISRRTALSNAQYQAGKLAESRQQFKEAEVLQKENQANYPQLYSLWGFRYCDLLLAVGEWREVQQRAEYSIEIAKKHQWLLDTALDQLSLGRASLQQAIDTTGEWIKSEPSKKISLELQIPIKLPEFLVQDGASLSILKQAKDWLDQAVEGLRKAGQEHYLPCGLLVRACYYRIAACMDLGKSQEKPVDSCTQNTQLAKQDLQEVYDIAQRGGMRLFLTDYHLETARLIFSIDLAQEPSTDANQIIFKQTASEHLKKAEQLIEETGYKRRSPELVYLQALCQAQNGK